MKTILKAVLAAVVVSTLAACGVGVEHDDQYAKQQQKDNDALTDQFSRVAGVYEGTMTSTIQGVAPQAGTFYLYITQEDGGKNPDGSPRSVATLRGRFMLDKVVADSDYTRLAANYNAVSGAISLAPAAGTQTDQNATTIEGHAYNESAQLTIKKGGGDWGYFQGTRTSKSAQAPVSGDEDELRARIFAVYRNVVGTYNARVDSGTQKIPVTMTLSITEQKIDQTSSATKPVLTAQFQRGDVAPDIGAYSLAVSYDQLSGRMSMIATAGGSDAVPGSKNLTGSGTFVNQVMTLQIYYRNGYMGEFKATRIPLR